MINGKTVVGVVLARADSKGLRNKNLKVIGGHSLLGHTILAAKKAATLDRIVLTTDSPQMARIGRRYGAEVPFLRPQRLARDTTHTPPVIEHAVRHLEREEGYRVDIVVTLQPTSPFRKGAHIDEAVRKLARHPHLDSVITVKEADYPAFWMFTAQRERLVPFVQDGRDYALLERQQLPRLYQPNGVVYVTRREVLKRKGVLSSAYAGGSTGYVVMDEVVSHDIDTSLDLLVAKLLARQSPGLLGH